MTWDFHVGMKVVWIGPTKESKSSTGWTSVGDRLSEDKIYTIREILSWKFIDGIELSIRLNEYRRVLKHTSGWIKDDCPVGARFFRPLNETPKHIELFRKLALDATEKKRVTVDA